MPRFSLSLFLLAFFIAPAVVAATDIVPDDIRYMLEDMYGANKKAWPAAISEKDLSNDGFPDWLVEKENCNTAKPCAAEIFICIPDKTGKCSGYCYLEVKNLKNIEDDLKYRKCESTC